MVSANYLFAFFDKNKNDLKNQKSKCAQRIISKFLIPFLVQYQYLLHYFRSFEYEKITKL